MSDYQDYGVDLSASSLTPSGYSLDHRSYLGAWVKDMFMGSKSREKRDWSHRKEDKWLMERDFRGDLKGQDRNKNTSGGIGPEKELFEKAQRREMMV